MNPANAVEPSAAESLNPNCRYHVLIVEDDPSMRAILAHVLSAIDPDVSYTWVLSVEDARRKLSEVRVSLIIADYRLAGDATGLDLWDDVSGAPSPVPFLLISGIALAQFATLANHRALAPTFLPKPFRASDCRALLKELLSGRRGASESDGADSRFTT